MGIGIALGSTGIGLYGALGVFVILHWILKQFCQFPCKGFLYGSGEQKFALTSFFFFPFFFLFGFFVKK